MWVIRPGLLRPKPVRPSFYHDGELFPRDHDATGLARPPARYECARGLCAPHQRDLGGGTCRATKDAYFLENAHLLLDERGKFFHSLVLPEEHLILNDAYLVRHRSE